MEEKVADFKVHLPHTMECDETNRCVVHSQLKNSKKGLFHPDDIKTIGLGPVDPAPKSAPLIPLNKKSSRPMLGGGFPSSSQQGPLNSAPALGSHGRSTSLTTPNSGSGSGSFGRAEARRAQSQTEFGKYTEDDDEDYDDVFGKPNGNGVYFSLLFVALRIVSH